MSTRFSWTCSSRSFGHGATRLPAAAAAGSAAALSRPISSSFGRATLACTRAALTASSRALSTGPTAFAFGPCSTALCRLCHYNYFFNSLLGASSARIAAHSAETSRRPGIRRFLSATSDPNLVATGLNIFSLARRWRLRARFALGMSRLPSSHTDQSRVPSGTDSENWTAYHNRELWMLGID